MSKEKEFLCEFIETYKSFSCLWKIKNKQYSDRNAKPHAYDIVIKKLQSVDRDANRESVLKKNQFSMYRLPKRIKESGRI